MSTQQLVKTLISSNKAIVFSKTYCPYCTLAKENLTKLNVAFKTIELDTDPKGSEIQNALFELTKQRSVPNIFINSKHVGGSDDLRALIRNKKIQSFLSN
ncbi:Glutaredoxin [Smittium mucronatum]|uniref:Glutaredoxin n=1 Tax=Smittium mucronatum TaxID=133383 RepID=A0A1R0H7T8_9FUNG|nr:Glutaredoxin [Smittium mucronatum]